MKFPKIIPLFLLILLLFSACTAPQAESMKEETSVAKDKESEEITLLTSFYPVHIFTLAVTEGTPLQVYNLTGEQAGCLHDYQLTTDDMRLITQSEVFVINGAGMEISFLTKAVQQNKDILLIDSSKDIALLEDGHDHEHDHGDADDIHDEPHDHEINSHIWLSVANAMAQTNNIAEGLSELYPQYAQQFQANARAYTEKLGKILPETGNYEQFRVISFHNAFSYLAEEMGFTVLESIEIEENSTPSANEMAALATLCSSGEVSYILSADDEGLAYAETLSRESGLPILILDPFTTAHTDTEAYITTQKANIEALKAVLKNE